MSTAFADGNGNLTSDGTFTYCYDNENHLTLILTAGTCSSQMTTLASYAYDAQGRRKSKTVNGTTMIAVTDADNREVLEYDGSSGAIGNWYAYALGPNDVLNQMNVAGGTRATFITDILGSIVGSLDAASGTLSETGYQTYGENPSLTSGTYQYTARRFDPETAGSAAQPSGLYYYRARMYSPAWGRFLQIDPIGLQPVVLGWRFGPSLPTSAQAGPTSPLMAGLSAATAVPIAASVTIPVGLAPSSFWYVAAENPYGYVGNDPINNVDPTGQDPFIGAPIGAVVGAIYGGIGAYLSPGSNFTSVLVGAIAGGVVGGAVGFADITNVGAAATIGGLASAAGDIASQVTVNLIAGQAPFANINYGSTIGAGIGGAVGGAAGGPLTSFIESYGVSELTAATTSNLVTGLAGLGAAYGGASVYSSSPLTK